MACWFCLSDAVGVYLLLMRGADGSINDCMNFLSLPHRHNVDPGDVVEKRVCMMEERRDLVLQMDLGSTPIIDLDRMMVTAVLGWFVLLVFSSLVSFSLLCPFGFL